MNGKGLSRWKKHMQRWSYEKKRHDAWLDAAQGSPRRRQPKNTKTKRQGAECPNTGGELPPKNSESLGNVPPTGQGAECHHLSTSRVRDEHDRRSPPHQQQL